jgi:hypothetical protein
MRPFRPTGSLRSVQTIPFVPKAAGSVTLSAMSASIDTLVAYLRKHFTTADGRLDRDELSRVANERPAGSLRQVIATTMLNLGHEKTPSDIGKTFEHFQNNPFNTNWTRQADLDSNGSISANEYGRLSVYGKILFQIAQNSSHGSISESALRASLPK